MPNTLLDFNLKSYEHGGYHSDVDLDPFSYLTQQDVLDELEVDILSPEARREISTIDPTAQDLAIQGFRFRQEGLDLAQDEALRAGQSSLQDMVSSPIAAGSRGFASSGDTARTAQNIRGSLMDDFAATTRGIGLDRDQAYLGLQQDIFNINKRNRDMIASDVFALDEDDYAFSSENVGLNQGAAEGQKPPIFAGTTPGETATGGDGQQYSWINGEWVNTNEQNQTQQGGTVYNTVPSSNVGDSIAVNTGSGLTYYTWSPETNSYIEQSSGSDESIDKP